MVNWNVVRHRGNIKWTLPVAGIALLAAVAVAIAPRHADPSGGKVTFTSVQDVVKERRWPCHSAQPTQPGFAQPPTGVVLETPDKIAAIAPNVVETAARLMSDHSSPQSARWPEGAIFTVGHSTLPIERFVALLHAYRIESLADILECKHLVNRQLQLARFHRRPDIVSDFVKDLADLLDRAGAEGHTDIVDPARGVQIEIEIAVGAAEAADIDDTSLDLGGREILVGDLARDLIDDQIDAFAAGGFEHLIDPAGIAGIHCEVGAEFLQPSSTRRIG